MLHVFLLIVQYILLINNIIVLIHALLYFD